MLVRTVMLVRCGDPAPTQLGIAIPWMAVRFVCVCVCVCVGWRGGLNLRTAKD